MSDLSNQSNAGGTTRRTVVRTAAHAAWAVPAIQIAVAAPAFADSTRDDMALVGTSTVTAVGNKGWKVSDFRVFSDGPRGANGVITLSLTLTSGTWDAKKQSLPAGWSATGLGTNVAELTYSGPIDVVSTSPWEDVITGPTLNMAAASGGPAQITVGPTLVPVYVTP